MKDIPFDYGWHIKHNKTYDLSFKTIKDAECEIV